MSMLVYTKIVKNASLWFTVNFERGRDEALVLPLGDF